MSDRKTNFNAGGGIGLLGWLFIILFILKLNPGEHLTSDVANWSWWVVTAPLWAPAALIAVFALVWGGIWFGSKSYSASSFAAKRRKKRLKKRLAERRERYSRNR